MLLKKGRRSTSRRSNSCAPNAPSYLPTKAAVNSVLFAGMNRLNNPARTSTQTHISGGHGPANRVEFGFADMLKFVIFLVVSYLF